VFNSAVWVVVELDDDLAILASFDEWWNEWRTEARDGIAEDLKVDCAVFAREVVGFVFVFVFTEVVLLLLLTTVGIC